MNAPNPAELNLQDHTILVVDDNPTNLGVIVNYLEDCGFRLLVARDGETGLKSAQNAKPDLILLDVMMPGINGFETCRRLKEDETTAAIPVIFMTALAETEDKIRGFQVGGVDYVTKPIQQEEVLARVTAHLKIRNLTRKLQAQNEDLQELTYELHEMNNELLKVTDEIRDANLALSKRAVQLEASNQVAQRITAILGLDELLPEMVKVIRAKFGYYFVGVWLVSDQHNHVVLQASASRDEAKKLVPGFAIPLANQSQSLIAWVSQNGQAKLVDRLDPGSLYQVMEELPETRSKLALPLRIGEEILGVLDIQSDHLAAFDSEDQKALQTLANQIAVAIRNAWLYGMEKKMRSMEEEKAQALTKLNADKDKFFSIISHDLRGPFTSLMGNAQFMAEVMDTLKPNDIQEMAQGMYNGAKAVYSLLDNLLTWSRMQREGGMAYQPESIELRPLAQKTVEVLAQTAAQKNICLENTIPGQLNVYADDHMLDTVIRNLTGNALKFTPAGGVITLSARPGPGKFIEVAVQDTGVGMSKQDIDKLFKLGDNYTTLGTNREQGSGLGLIICKEMIERNGGRIWIDSAPGRGATVRFTVPAPAN